MAGLVPVEIITLYAAALAAVPSAWRPVPMLEVGGAAATLVTLSVHARRGREVAPVAQHLMRVLVFATWTFVLRNPLSPAPPVDPRLTALALVALPVAGLFLFPPPRVRRRGS